jgi:hypothetical protein
VREEEGAAEVKQAEAAEKVVVTLPAVSTTPDITTVHLTAVVPIVTAAESTTVEVTIRREGLTGAEVAKVLTKPGASAEQEIVLQAKDKPGEVAGMAYVVTVKPGVAKEVTAKKATLKVEF